MVNSRILIGNVMHARLEPVRHEFQYPLYMYSFDLDELSELDLKFKWFGYNKVRLVSIHDKDYLTELNDGDVSYGGLHLSIKEKLKILLKKFNYSKEIEKVTLITAARYFNYVFNPVSFFYCYNSCGDLTYFVAEVNNTFNERHLYILDCSQGLLKDSEKLANIRTAKAFHVSPFNDMRGDYDFHFSDIDKKLDVRINIVKDGKVVMVTRLWGYFNELSSAKLLSVLARFPLAASLSMPRILWQAFKLRYFHKLPVFRKPTPSSSYTIKVASASWLEKLAQSLVTQLLSKIEVGTLSLKLPDGKVLKFGGVSQGHNAEIDVNHYRFFKRIVFAGAVGVGESFTKNEWSSANLTETIKLLIDNREFIDEKMLLFARLGRSINWIKHFLNHNSIIGSKRNIEAHYDLGNEFFKLFLDPTLSYSSAYFNSEQDTLEEAQLNKIRRLLDKANIQEGSNLLEIGSGWGALAIEAAKNRNCNVTSITLSNEQLKLANELIANEGLSEKAQVKYCDYRHLHGSFDRIVSVEMLEAVGHKYLGDFFRVCDNVLNKDGIVVLQVITIPDQRYKQYLSSCDWIQKYIFPGACLPSLEILSNAISRNSGLIIENIENIGPHYAPTLSAWRENMLQKRSELLQMGYTDEFIKTWEYYFSYCEAAFASRTLNVLQLVLTRPKNNYLIDKDSKQFHTYALKMLKRRA